MSSAILYLAIVAIWACVLIPRWLRRDSAHGVAAAFSDTMAPGASIPETSAATPAAPAAPAALGGTGGADEPVTDVMPPRDTGDAPLPLPSPLPAPLDAALPAALDAEESRRRMLAARRRLLGMLIILEGAASALAFIGLAAMWVVVPPSIMLGGYLLLLREAGRADAERAQREAKAAAARARAIARLRHGGRARAGQRPTSAEGAPLPGTAAAAAAAAATSAAELAARFAAAPVPADYEDSGRDFAPGLAGKYTPSYADSDLTDEDRYGYAYEEPMFRRAVGD